MKTFHKEAGLLVAVIPHGPSLHFPVSYLLNEEMRSMCPSCHPRLVTLLHAHAGYCSVSTAPPSHDGRHGREGCKVAGGETQLAQDEEMGTVWWAVWGSLPCLPHLSSPPSLSPCGLVFGQEDVWPISAEASGGAACFGLSSRVLTTAARAFSQESKVTLPLLATS